MRSKIGLSTCVVKPAGEATLSSIQRPVTVGRVGVGTGLGVGAAVPNTLDTDPMRPLTVLLMSPVTCGGSTIGAPVILSSPTRKSGVNVSAPAGGDAAATASVSPVGSANMKETSRSPMSTVRIVRSRTIVRRGEPLRVSSTATRTPSTS